MSDWAKDTIQQPAVVRHFAASNGSEPQSKEFSAGYGFPVVITEFCVYGWPWKLCLGQEKNQ